jgi:FkbM family methyltransferase
MTPPVPAKARLFYFLGRHLRGRGYATIIRYDLGQRISLDLDDWIGWQIFLTGLYAVEEDQTAFFRRLVRRDMVVFDVGAHIGYYTLQAAARVGPGGQVHAFEPVQRTYAALTRNIELNRLRNVRAQRRIVHQRRGLLEIFPASPGNTAMATLRRSAGATMGRSERVEAIDLDSYVAEHAISRVDVIKMDIEGSEPAVLAGMPRLLAQPGLRLLVEVKRGLVEHADDRLAMFERLASYGYRPWRIGRRGPRVVEPDAIRNESLVLFARERERDRA